MIDISDYYQVYETMHLIHTVLIEIWNFDDCCDKLANWHNYMKDWVLSTSFAVADLDGFLGFLQKPLSNPEETL